MDTTSPVPSEGFKDRKTGLLVFGILLLLVGAVCALFVPLIFVGQVMSAKMGDTETNWRMILPSVVFYLFLAAVFIAVGVGSIKARRWARALALVMGWSWLVIGVLTIVISSATIFQAFNTTQTTQQLPPGAMMVAVTVMLIIFSVIFIILPGAVVLFYGRKDVKATCETRDPAVRWTDRVPLPLIALVLWIGFGALTMLLTPFAYNGVLPLFGKIVSGIPGTLISLAVAALWGYAAWAIFKLKSIGWWIVFVVLLTFGISSVLTFRNVEMTELYTAMGYPKSQIEQMGQVNVLDGKTLSLYVGLMMLPFLGLLLWTKRFFPKGKVVPAT